MSYFDELKEIIEACGHDPGGLVRARVGDLEYVTYIMRRGDYAIQHRFPPRGVLDGRPKPHAHDYIMRGRLGTLFFGKDICQKDLNTNLPAEAIQYIELILSDMETELRHHAN